MVGTRYPFTKFMRQGTCQGTFQDGANEGACLASQRTDSHALPQNRPSVGPPLVPMEQKRACLATLAPACLKSSLFRLAHVRSSPGPGHDLEVLDGLQVFERDSLIRRPSIRSLTPHPRSPTPYSYRFLHSRFSIRFSVVSLFLVADGIPLLSAFFVSCLVASRPPFLRHRTKEKGSTLVPSNTFRHPPLARSDQFFLQIRPLPACVRPGCVGFSSGHFLRSSNHCRHARDLTNKGPSGRWP